MKRTRLVCLCLCLCLCLAAGLLAPAASSAQQRPGADEMKAYGGSYAVECGKPDAPRLSVTADAISVERDGQRLVGRYAMIEAEPRVQAAPAPDRGVDRFAGRHDDGAHHATRPSHHGHALTASVRTVAPPRCR